MPEPLETLRRMRAELAGRPCFGGLDLSSNTDLTAFTLVFPEDHWAVLTQCWIPEDQIEDRVRRDRVPYDLWLKEGYIQATGGNVIDYAFIRHAVLEAAGTYGLQGVAYDPWRATETAIKLSEAGLEVVACRQGFATLSEPSKYLETLVLSGQLSHGGDPVLRWMAENVSIAFDPAGNIRPVKDNASIYRIDGIVSLIMAIWLWQRQKPQRASVYEDWETEGDEDESGTEGPQRVAPAQSIYEREDW